MLELEGAPFRVIIADPPWKYGSKRALVGTGGKGRVEGCESIKQVDATEEYPCMDLEEICALSVKDIAAKDAALFMWVTNAFLADGSAAKVVSAWGFAPKTVLTWAKTKKGSSEPSMKTGYWFRGATEHVVFATRGRFSRPDGWPAIPTWFAGSRLPHSVKPPTIHEIAERLPSPRLEMFARRRREGWAVFGNEVE